MEASEQQPQLRRRHAPAPPGRRPLPSRTRGRRRHPPPPDPPLRIGEQQPALDVAQRLAAALGVTLDELAGGTTDRVKLDGTWWAAWQTFCDGQQVIATQPVGLNQHGSTIQIEALERSPRTNAAATSGAANCASGTARS